MFNARNINYLVLNELPEKSCKMELKIFEGLFVIAKFVNDLPSILLIYSYLVNEFGIVRDNDI